MNIDRIKNLLNQQSPYNYQDCILIPFAGSVLPETVSELQEILGQSATIKVFEKYSGTYILITPKNYNDTNEQPPGR